MAWTAPMTFVAGSVLTAAQLNTYLRDNLNECPTAKATTNSQIFTTVGANQVVARTPDTNYVSSTSTTTSTSYTDLATFGPQVSIVTGGKAFVIMSAYMANNTAGGNAIMSVAVSGATTVAAGDENSSIHSSATAGGSGSAAKHGTTILYTGLTAGTNVFTMKYRTVSGATTATFSDRKLAIIPL